MKNVFGLVLTIALFHISPTLSFAQSNEELFFASAESEFSANADNAVLIYDRQGDILDVLGKNVELSTFATALRASGLTEKLNSGDAFTLFAPTNEAFEALPKGTIEKLLMPENKKGLKKLLFNHIITGTSNAEMVSEIKTLSCWSGQELIVDVGSAGVSVGDAKVLKKDLQVENGIVHVIDKVLVSN